MGFDCRGTRSDVVSRKLAESRLGRHWPLAALLFIPLLVFWRPFLLDETLFYQDLVAQYFPRERLLGRTGLTGWNPHVFLGMTFVGDPQSAPYEPVRALLRQLRVDESTGLVLFLTAYLCIATVGFYCFALRKGASPIGAATAALAGLWGGLYIVRFRHPPLFTSLCVVPWAVLFADRLAVERRLLWAIALAMVIAIGAFGGGPQGPYMIWLFVSAYLCAAVLTSNSRGAPRAAWGLAWRVTAGGAIFLGLTAFQYLPVALALPQAARHEATLAFVGQYSLSPESWARLLVPDLYGNDMAGTYFGPANYHEQMIYLGIAPLLLVVLALMWRRRVGEERGLLALAGGSLVMATGRYLPAFYLAYLVVPGWRLFRCPGRYSWFLAFAMAVIAGLLVSRIAAEERPPDADRVRRLLRRVWSGLATGCALLAITAWLFVDRASAFAHATVAWAACRSALLLLASGFALERWLLGVWSGRRVSRLLVTLTVLDLGLQWLPYRQTVPRAEAFPASALSRALVETAPGRVLVHEYRGDGLPEIVPLLNWGEAVGYDDLRGYNQLVPSDLLALFERADVGHLAVAKHYALAPVDPADWLLDLAAVRRIVARPRDWPARWRSLPVVARTGGYEVRERSGELPRAWLVGAVERVPDAVALERLPQIDIHRVATVSADLHLPAISAAPAGTVGFISRAADDLVLRVHARTPALLVLADRFDPGWSATVDGRPERIVRADYLLRGVQVEPGMHRVQMHFAAPGCVTGRRVSIATALCTSLLLLLLGARARRDGTHGRAEPV